MNVDDSYEQEITRHVRWNFIVNTSDLLSVSLARSFIFHLTVLPLYASYLTSSSVLIGLVPAIYEVGFLLPQLLMSRRAESLSVKKPFVVKMSIFERLPFLLIALSIFLRPEAPRWFAYLMLSLNIAVASSAGGLATPAWKGMLGKVIRPRRRALLFSLGSGVGGFLGIGGALLAGYILDTWEYPQSFGLCFLLAFLGQALSWFFLTLNREPERKPHVISDSLKVYLKQLPAILQGDRNFTRYLASQVLAILGSMGVSFYIIYGRYIYSISDGFAGSMTMVALFSQSIGIPVLGWFSDRLGHKWLAEMSAVLGIGALLLMLVIPGPLWLFPVFIMANLSVTGRNIAVTCISMEIGGVDRLPTYTALSGTLLGIPTLIAPVLGGWVLDLLGFPLLFTLALVFALAGLIVLRFGVRDPRMYRPY